MSNIDALFDGMPDADLNNKGNYMGPGRFLVETKAIKYKDSKHRGKSYIIEFTVVESTNPAHEPGSSGSWVIKLDKPQAWGDIKAFMMALAMDIDPKTAKTPKQDPELHAKATELAKAAISAEHAQKLGAEEDFLLGLPVRLETTMTKTQKGGDFTIHAWSPASKAFAAAA